MPILSSVMPSFSLMRCRWLSLTVNTRWANHLVDRQCTQNLKRKKPLSVSMTSGRMSCSTTTLRRVSSISLARPT